jgi:multicomponent Na+:H+ antiporter subunit B
VTHHSILRSVTKLLLPYILLFALYTQFHGDYGPGGGFQAGVIFAAGIVLYSLIFTPRLARRVVSYRAVYIGMSLGILIYAGVGVVTMFLGGNYLDYNMLNHHDAAHGQHLGILLVELGVGITVAAVVICIFYAFVDRLEP